CRVGADQRHIVASTAQLLRQISDTRYHAADAGKEQLSDKHDVHVAKSCCMQGSSRAARETLCFRNCTLFLRIALKRSCVTSKIRTVQERTSSSLRGASVCAQKGPTRGIRSQ